MAATAAMAATTTLLVLLLLLLQSPHAAHAQIGGDDMGEAFGRPGRNAFSVHHQPEQQHGYQMPGAGGKAPLKINPAFFPRGMEGSEQAKIQDDKPGPYTVKLEKGRQLRCVRAGLEGVRSVCV